MDDDDDDDDDDDEFDEGYESDDEQPVMVSTPASTIQASSAPIIGMKYWTKELKNLINLRLPIPLSLASALIKVFYAVCLSRGQSVDISFYTDAISLLAKEGDLLLEHGLRLDWKPVYEEPLERHSCRWLLCCL
ncbi:unnamed protein product [Ambrosiozyma monospora]|uniref:Unnamed protein product n=1 Tax=Ambrosiozyma monospora TaxID=43982 RepID=A0A9W6WMP8_AMBMO|nr:unnamed protein product [Ambrosiozyma monospora]